MKKRLFLAALSLILLSNAVVLGKVAFNRAAVLNELVLTEREMQSRYSSVKENSSTQLQLRWHTPMQPSTNYYYGYQNILPINDNQREMLGFKPLNCQQGSYRYNDNETTAWVLMELDGQAYLNDLSLLESRIKEAQAENKNRQETKSLEEQLKRLREYDSRLYAIAVSAEPGQLLPAIKNKEKQFLLKAIISDSKYCNNEIFIKQLSMGDLYLPKSLITNTTGLPRNYFVHIAIGNLGEAWIENITPR